MADNDQQRHIMRPIYSLATLAIAIAALVIAIQTRNRVNELHP